MQETDEIPVRHEDGQEEDGYTRFFWIVIEENLHAQ